MKTPEEKRAAAKERARRKAEQFKRIPHAYLRSPHSHTSLAMSAGEMSILVYSSKPFDVDTDAFEDDLTLSDPASLGQFIRALTARYNVLVKEANAVAAECVMEELTRIPGGEV